MSFMSSPGKRETNTDFPIVLSIHLKERVKVYGYTDIFFIKGNNFYYSVCFIMKPLSNMSSTVKILKIGTPQTIAIIVLKIEKFDLTLH